MSTFLVIVLRYLLLSFCHIFLKKQSAGKCHVSRHKKSLKRRDEMRSIIKFDIPSFKIGHSTAVLILSSWFPFPLLVAILLFKRIFMASHMTLFRALENLSFRHRKHFALRDIFSPSRMF